LKELRIIEDSPIYCYWKTWKPNNVSCFHSYGFDNSMFTAISSRSRGGRVVCAYLTLGICPNRACCKLDFRRGIVCSCSLAPFLVSSLFGSIAPLRLVRPCKLKSQPTNKLAQSYALQLPLPYSIALVPADAFLLHLTHSYLQRLLIIGSPLTESTASKSHAHSFQPSPLFY
jgi:hypothetical protein